MNVSEEVLAGPGGSTRRAPREPYPLAPLPSAVLPVPPPPSPPPSLLRGMVPWGVGLAPPLAPGLAGSERLADLVARGATLLGLPLLGPSVLIRIRIQIFPRSPSLWPQSRPHGGGRVIKRTADPASSRFPRRPPSYTCAVSRVRRRSGTVLALPEGAPPPLSRLTRLHKVRSRRVPGQFSGVGF